jgi:hypothetical protein
LSNEQIKEHEMENDRKSLIGTVKKKAAVPYFNTTIPDFSRLR